MIFFSYERECTHSILKEDKLYEKEMGKNCKGGFTLAELLIVVAIIAVLVAVSIPIFTGQIRKARLATNQANARAAYAAAIIAETEEQGKKNISVLHCYAYDPSTGKLGNINYNSNEPMDFSWESGANGYYVISNWNVNTTGVTAKVKLGDKVATEWTIFFDRTGNLRGIAYKMPS